MDVDVRGGEGVVKGRGL